MTPKTTGSADRAILLQSALQPEGKGRSTDP
jgi:hypothetical protein